LGCCAIVSCDDIANSVFLRGADPRFAAHADSSRGSDFWLPSILT
jgi:hypothetical protein